MIPDPAIDPVRVLIAYTLRCVLVAALVGGAIGLTLWEIALRLST